MSASSDSDRHAPPAIDLRPWHERPYVVGIFVLLALFVLPSVIWLLVRDGGSENSPGQEVADGDSSSPELHALEKAGRKALVYAEDQVTPASDEQVRFMNQVKHIQAAWQELQEQATAWYDRHPKLLTQDDGKKLAAKAELVEEFAKIDQWERPSLQDVQQFEERLAGFVSIVERFEKPLTLEDDPSRDAFTELSRLDQEVSNALEQMKRVSESVQALERRAAELPLAPISLEAAIDKVRQEAMARKAEQILAKRHDRLDKKNDELVALEIKDVGRRMGDALRIARAETARLEKAKRRMDTEADRAARDREEARVNAELEGQFDAEYPRMKGYLTIFTSDGYTQRIGDDFKPIAVKGPVSYRTLVNAGLLNAGEDSLRAFWSAIDKGTNDRDLGAFPAHSFSSGHVDRHYETVLKIREFLRRFGPLMVEREELAP